MSQVDISSHADNDCQSPRPVTIYATGKQYDAWQRLLDREPREVARLAELLAGPSVFDGTESGEIPTPG